MTPYLATIGMLTLLCFGLGLFAIFCFIIMLAFFEASDWLGSDTKAAWFIGSFVLAILAMIITLVTLLI